MICQVQMVVLYNYISVIIQIFEKMGTNQSFNRFFAISYCSLSLHIKPNQGPVLNFNMIVAWGHHHLYVHLISDYLKYINHRHTIIIL